MTRLILPAAISVAVIIALVVWFATRGENPDRGIALGASLYGRHCASCHGTALEGQPNWQTRLANGRMPAPPHDETGHTWHHPDQDLFRIVKEGVAAIVPGYQTDMPAFAGLLTDPEILAILTYIKSTWPGEQRDYQAARTADRMAQDGG